MQFLTKKCLKHSLFIATILITCFAYASRAEVADVPLTPSEIIAQSTDSDWRQLQASDLLYLTLDSGTIIFELAPEFAPQHIANLRTLVGENYFDGLAIVRSHDNYVVQWGDPQAGTEQARPLGNAKESVVGEYYRPRSGLEFVAIPSRDAYALEVGFVRGFASGADSERAWLTHCYGALGVGRDVSPDSGNASSLYVVTGHAPRHLDRNVTLLGRAISGIELLSSLPRGSGTLGFYADTEQTMGIISIRMGDQLPENERKSIEAMRTDTKTFTNYVKARTYRKNSWFIDPVGKIEICNVGVPTRIKGQ